MSDHKPQDPRRFYKQRVSAKLKNPDTVRVTLKFDYMTWCCDGPHEVADAIKALDYVLETIEPTDWEPTLQKDAKERAEAKGFVVSNYEDDFETEGPPLTSETQRAYNQGRSRGHEEIQKPLLEVLKDNNHPIWESENLQEALIRLVEGAHLND